MSFNIGAGAGLWVEDVAAGGLRSGYELPLSLHNLKLLAEDAQLETKRRNKGDRVRARRANLCERGERMTRVPLS
jgi:hypothetical protein